MAPYVFYLIATRDYGSTLVWFGAAGVSDALDGYLARKLGGESRAGAMLDPIADKVLLSGSFVALALARAVPWWLAWLVLGRDVLILLFAGGVLMFTKVRRGFPPSIWGKLSTLAQIAFVLAVVAGGERIVQILQWTTVALTAWSGVDYIRRVRA
jgi:cardiolipin synthase